MKGHLIDRVLGVSLTVCAIVLVVAILQRTQESRPEAAVAPVRYVDDWRDLLAAGHLDGNAHAPVVLIEFSDFECPFCRLIAPEIAKLKKKYGNKMSVVYIHLPLKQHRFAIPAARAAECANGEGRFWELSLAIFAKQDSLGLKTWESYASEAGVTDITKFAECTRRNEPLPLVERGMLAAKRVGVTWTPGIVINGWLYREITADVLEQAIEEAFSGKGPRRTGTAALPSGSGLSLAKGAR